MSFLKLDEGVLDSSLWPDDDALRVFLTAGLMAKPHTLHSPTQTIGLRDGSRGDFIVPEGPYGAVWATPAAIIRRAMVADQKRGFEALDRLGSPDPDSRNADFGGRRMVRVSFGFIVLNFQRYRRFGSSHTEHVGTLTQEEASPERQQGTRRPPEDPQTVLFPALEAEAYAEPDDVARVLEALLGARRSLGQQTRRRKSRNHTRLVRRPFDGADLGHEGVEQWRAVIRHAAEFCRRRPTTNEGSRMADLVMRLDNLSQPEKFVRYLEMDHLDEPAEIERPSPGTGGVLKIKRDDLTGEHYFTDEWGRRVLCDAEGNRRIGRQG